MVQVKVEHVIVVLLGLFLLYHFMGSCGCNKVEGWIAMDYDDDKPYVKTLDYCGLSDDGEVNYDGNITKAQGKYDRSVRELTNSQNKYLLADGNRSTAQGKYEDYSSRFFSETNEEEANAHRRNADRQAEAANTAIQDMMDAASAIIDQTDDVSVNLTDLQTAIAAKANAIRECSKPNRLLHRYLPDIACVGEGVGKRMDKNSFGDLFVEDQRNFSGTVDNRLYGTPDAGGKRINACTKLTAAKINDYPFNGMTDKGDGLFGATVSSRIPDTVYQPAPTPIQVMSPLPTKYPKYDADYLDTAAHGKFESD